MFTKRNLILITLAGFVMLASAGELSPAHKKVKKSYKDKMRISSVQDFKDRNAMGDKVEVIFVRTVQDKREHIDGLMRITVELEDKEDNLYCAQMILKQGGRASRYMGKDEWTFHISHGDLNRPKLSAYVVEYGVKYEDVFVPVAEECDHADTAAEILKRGSKILKFEKAHHTFWYDGS